MHVGYNPATFALEVIGSRDEGSNEVEVEAEVEIENTDQVDYAAIYRESDEYQKLMQDIEKIIEMQGEELVDNWKQPSVISQYRQTYYKWNFTYFRAVSYNGARLFVMLVQGMSFSLIISYYQYYYFILLLLFTGLLYGILYYQMPITNVSEVQSMIGALFFGAMFTGFICTVTALPLYFTERNVYYREKYLGMYSTFNFSFVTFLVEFPYIFFVTLIFTVPFYLLAGLESSVEAFLVFFVVFFLYTYVATMLGHMISASVPNAAFGVVVATGLISVWALFSGYMVSLDEIVSYLKWLSTISPTRYMLAALVSSQLSCESCSIDPETSSLINFTCNNGQQCDQVCDENKSGCTIMFIPTPIPEVSYKVTVWDYSKATWGFDEPVMERIFVLILCVFIVKLLHTLLLAFVNQNKR